MNFINPSTKVVKFKIKSLLLPYIFQKAQMHAYDVSEALYTDCEIHDPKVRGATLSPMVGL